MKQIVFASCKTLTPFKCCHICFTSLFTALVLIQVERGKVLLKKVSLVLRFLIQPSENEVKLPLLGSQTKQINNKWVNKINNKTKSHFNYDYISVTSHLRETLSCGRNIARRIRWLGFTLFFSMTDRHGPANQTAHGQRSSQVGFVIRTGPIMSLPVSTYVLLNL